MGIILETITHASQNVCHAHLHFIAITCSKFHLDDLKSVEEFGDNSLPDRPSPDSSIPPKFH